MNDEELEGIRKRKLVELMKRMNNDMPERPIVVTDANFDDTVKKYPVVVVDFWAVWCGPCKMMEPVIEELAQTYRGKVVFGKLNVDENPATATKYGIMAIPTLLVFQNGSLVDQVQGAMPASALTPTIDRYVT
ncbi:MAG: thioredoxin [Thermoplasmata archaeon]